MVWVGKGHVLGELSPLIRIQDVRESPMVMISGRGMVRYRAGIGLGYGWTLAR